MGKIRDYVNRNLRKLAIAGVLGAATIAGTFGGNEGGLPPFYNRKTGDSYGINLGGVTLFEEGSNHCGVSLSIFNHFYGGKLNGVAIGMVNGSRTAEVLKVNSLEIKKSEVNGLELGVANWKYLGQVDGLQIGLMNINDAGKNVQIGVYNSSGGEGRKVKRGILFNSRWDEGFAENR